MRYRIHVSAVISLFLGITLVVCRNARGMWLGEDHQRLPFDIGGVGVVEAGMVGLYALLGVPKESGSRCYPCLSDSSPLDSNVRLVSDVDTCISGDG